MPDPILGERACAVWSRCAPPACTKPTLAELCDYLAKKGYFAKIKLPERLVAVVAEMPMTPTRKVKKTELIKLLKKVSCPGSNPSRGRLFSVKDRHVLRII